MKGWRNDNYRHSLAARGLTRRRYAMAYVPTYGVGDMAPIAGDIVGTAGAATVGWIPLVVGAGVVYGGSKYVKEQAMKARSARAKQKKKRHKR
jgi:ethanolamine utilization microcompartment shell protein EutS